jgi:hypothetical protein
MSSMSSSSSSGPSVSVVIGSTSPAASLAECLRALEPQRAGAQVVVCEAVASDAGVRQRFSWATFLERPGATVPELWRDGIERGEGEIVALTIGCMQPAPDWLATIRAEQRDHHVIAGAIEPGEGLRARDWAEYFVRYTRDMLPFHAHDCPDLPGDNSAYRRDLLARVRDEYRDGFWEPVVNGRLARTGETLWHTPALVVRQGRSAGLRAFLRQRLVHGRAHGRQRGAEFGLARNVVGVVAAPLVPPLLTIRAVRAVLERRRLRARLFAVVGLVFLFDIAWAVGESAGHAQALVHR